MVRRRGRARRSYAYLRIKKYRLKWKATVIPERFKLLIRPMEAKISDHLTFQDAVEIQTIVECQDKGVPEADYPHYLSFSKRAFKIYMTVWYTSAEDEVAILKQEFILRGLRSDVLDQLDDIMFSKAGRAREIPLPKYPQTQTWDFEDQLWNNWLAYAQCTPIPCVIANNFNHTPAGQWSARAQSNNASRFYLGKLFDFGVDYDTPSSVNISFWWYGEQAAGSYVDWIRIIDHDTGAILLDWTWQNIMVVPAWTQFIMDISAFVIGHRVRLQIGCQWTWNAFWFYSDIDDIVLTTIYP